MKITERDLRNWFPADRRFLHFCAKYYGYSFHNDEVVERAFFGARPAEELYDLEKDPHQIHNLAQDPEFAEILETHRQFLKNWIKETGDKGQHAESKESLKACLDRWQDKCVNPEFDALR